MSIPEQHYLGYKTYDKISNDVKARIYKEWICGRGVTIKQLAFEYQLHKSTIWKIIDEIKGPETIYRPVTLVLESGV